MRDQLRKLALRDGRYSPEAFLFLFDALEPALRLAGKDAAEGQERHITGQELVAGLCSHARESFGPLTPKVWRAWGIRDAVDWGHIVFLLVDAGHLRRQDTDTLADFDSALDFEAQFVTSYKPQLPREMPAGPGSGGGERGEGTGEGGAAC